MPRRDPDIESYLEELRSAFLYQVLAEKEKGTPRENLFRQLSIESHSQSAIWERKIHERGLPTPTLKKNFRTWVVIALIRSLGPKHILPVLAGMKVRGLSVYQAPHYDHSEAGEKRRHRSIRGGGNFRAAVFGVNDGLVSNVSLILGMAGATTDSHVILMSGCAGLIAGASSMAAGEFISVRSQRELYEHQIALEKAELAEFPEEEAAELAMIYQARGMPPEDARALGKKMIADPVKGLETLAREELGINPEMIGSEWGAAGASFLAFSMGALIPLMPLLVIKEHSLNWTMGFSAAMMFSVGVAISLFTGRQALLGGLRMLLIGSLAASITYAIGTLVS